MFKISIGIPAYNESENLTSLIKCLMSQVEEDFQIIEIIIVNDNSNDGTEKQISKIKDKIIKVVNNSQRLGQALSQNKILKRFKGDILVFLNADLFIKDNYFISKLISPFKMDKKIGLVSAKIIPLPANTFFEKIINYSQRFKASLYVKFNNSENIYLCCGRGRAFLRDFAKKISWPSINNEDAYSYLYCLTLNYKFVYQKNAEVYYRSPANYKDHHKQSCRFLKGSKALVAYFPKSLLKKEYNIPASELIKTSVEYLFKNPLLFISYFLIFSLVKLQASYSYQYSSRWDISKSSKRLNISDIKIS